MLVQAPDIFTLIETQTAHNNDTNDICESNFNTNTTVTSEHDRSLSELTVLYHDFEREGVEVRYLSDGDSLKNLVTFEKTRNKRIHRWYNFKEGYSHTILSWLYNKNIIYTDNLLLLDPFCGVGTTLLSSQLIERDFINSSAVGIEHNPAIRFIATAKLLWHCYDVSSINKIFDKLQQHTGRKGKIYPVPILSTFSAVRKSGKTAFFQESLQDLIHYRHYINENCVSESDRTFFMMAWTAIIELASNTRKDGRALRLLDVDEPPNVKELLIEQCKIMLDDIITLQSCRNPNISAKVISGDGRNSLLPSKSFNLICYSPPYLNNIDYTEVYKLELWLREDVTNQEQFKSLRLGSFRSHPSIVFPGTSLCDTQYKGSWIHRLKQQLITVIPKDDHYNERKRLLAGYIDDLILSLKEQLRVAMTGASIVCIVGNSLHGGQQRFPVCTDLLVAAAAQAVGITVDYIQVARQLPRRDHQNGWLRESIIIMHPE